jgi:hypothetical protein
MDLPSGRHHQGCNLSFADGRADHWKWRYPKEGTGGMDVTNSLDFLDLRQLQTAIPDVNPNSALFSAR